MAITVLNTTTGATGGGGAVSIDLTGLGLAEGNTILAVGGFGDNNATPGPTTMGYTVVRTPAGGGSNLPIVGAWAKRMGASPDTTLVFAGSGSTSSEAAYIVYVLDGVDPADISDVAPTSSGNSNPPAIVPVTDKALVVAVLFAATATVTAEPSGYANLLPKVQGGTFTISVAGATKEVDPAASEDPGTFTASGVLSARSFTMALRPSPPVAPTDSFGDFTDQFTAESLDARWTLENGTEPTLVGGRALITAACTISAGASAPSPDPVTGDFAGTFMSLALTVPDGYHVFFYLIDDDFSNYLGFDINFEAGKIQLWSTEEDGGTDPVFEDDYDPEVHRALRFFEDAGSIYAQYWTGTAWSTVWSETAGAFTADARDDTGVTVPGSPAEGDAVELWSYNVLAFPDAPTGMAVEPFDTTARLTLTFAPDADDSADRHLRTRWRVTTDADTGFATPLVDEIVEDGLIVDYLTDALLTAETDYRADAATEGVLGWGPFCTAVEFTTLEAIPVGNTPSLSAVDETTDAIEVSISAYTHPDGAVEPGDFDPDDPHPVLGYSEIQLRLASDSDWSTPLETITVPYIDGALSARFEGLTVGTAYKLRGRQFDDYLGVFTAYSADLSRSTDSAPVTAPLTPTQSDPVCGRNIVVTGSAFAHSGAGTHANTRVRICYGTSCQVIIFAGALTTVTLEDVPGGAVTLEIAYQDNAGAWGPYSATKSCVIPMFPPNVTYTEPPHGEVIQANQLVEWEARDPDAIGWHYDVEYSADGGSTWIELFEDRVTPSFTFTIAGRANGDYLIRVRTRNPDTDELGEWSVLPIIIDRTASTAIHYHFADLDELLPTWRQVGDGPEHITFTLRDTHDPDADEDFRVGLEARNVHGGTTVRRSGLVFDELGEPDEFDVFVAFELIGEKCQFYPYQFANPQVTRPGTWLFGTREGAARSGILTHMSWETGWYLGFEMRCVSDGFRDYASAYSAYYANLPANSTKSLRYGRSMRPGTFRTVTYRDGSTPAFTGSSMTSTTTDRTGGGYIYTDPDGVLGRARQIFVMAQRVRRGTDGVNAGWNIQTSIYGPGNEYSSTQFIKETGTTGKRLTCGSCGIGFEDLDRIGVGRAEGVIFTDFALNVVSYGSCEPPDGVAGCEADWDLTFFDDDDVTPRYGTADNEGNVGEADFYDRITCPRPYLKIPKNFSATEVDYPTGSTIIGGVTFQVVDKRLVASDQSTGIVSVFVHESVGRRIVCRRWREDLGMVTVFDGIVDTWSVEDTGPNLVTYTFNALDPRERERNVALFTRNETFALWPTQGPIASYGLLPNDLGYLLTPAQPADALEFLADAPAGGLFSGSVVLTTIDADHFVRDKVAPFGYVTLDAVTGYYRAYDITVRWRLAAGGNWHYLRDMPKLDPGPAIIPPETGVTAPFTWRVYLGSTIATDLPDDEDLIDIQILAAKTSDASPFYWDIGTYGDGLLATYRGDFSRVKPRIRYSLTALEEFALSTGNARFIVRKPYPNLREFVQEHWYAPIGSAPSFDADMRIAPSKWELPPADVELVELDVDWIIPDGGFSMSTDSVINRVKYTYIKESVIPNTADAFKQFVYSLPPGVATQFALDAANAPNLAEWERLIEEKIPKDYPHGPSIAVFGERPIEYEPLTVRSSGLLGEVLQGLFGVDTADRIAERVAFTVLSRFAWGAAEYDGRVVSGMAHGPTFDPFTLDLVVGQWVIATVPWLPEFSLGVRNMRRYMQIKSLKDEDIGHRHLVLVDGGPVLTASYDYGGGEDLLSPPVVGTLVEVPDEGTGGSRVEVPIAFPGGAPLGYRAAVDYAVNATEPAADSGLWVFAGFVLTEGSAFTPAIPAGYKVWIRARGEALGRRPSAWTAATSITLTAVPGLLQLFVTIDGSGEPTVHWVKNPYSAGLVIERSIGALGHTPSYTEFDQVDADDVELVLTGDVVDEGTEEIYVQVTCYPGFSLGAVSGSPGSVYVVREDQREVE